MLSEAKHPRWIDLTLSASADIPLLVEGEGQQGEVAIPAKERDQRVRFAILTLSSLCDR
jgi:hypothetical protein